MLRGGMGGRLGLVAFGTLPDLLLGLYHCLADLNLQVLR